LYDEFITDKNNLITKGIDSYFKKKEASQALQAADEKEAQAREAKLTKDARNGVILAHAKLVAFFLNRCAIEVKASAEGNLINFVGLLSPYKLILIHTRTNTFSYSGCLWIPS
jgi:hypothetical protein